MNKNEIFDELFVLELANNHLGRVERGLQIIHEHSRIVRFNNARATIKLQFRDVDNFIHKDFRQRTDIRYIKKTLDTRLSRKDYGTLVAAVRENGCLTSATPFDEASVDLCHELDLDIIKLASSDVNDWFLIEKIAALRKPVIASTGGSSLRNIDDLVKFFTRRNIPLALNHCVSIYPSEDSDLELNQIDFLRNRYPHLVIGLSTHEFTDWHSSVMIAYAKGARSFERHIDIAKNGATVSPYSSLPHQIDEWFKAVKKAQEMCGGGGTTRRVVPQKELEYLYTLVRGVYAKRALPAGHIIHHNHVLDDFYLAIPLQKGQLSCRELMSGEVLKTSVEPHQPLMIDNLDTTHSVNEALYHQISKRGL
jgi:N-acetylneuraminate synthase